MKTFKFEKYCYEIEDELFRRPNSFVRFSVLWYCESGLYNLHRHMNV
jgi:hypothetical protein